STAVDMSDAAATAAISRTAAYRVTSSLRTQDAVDALRAKHGVPTAYTARPAGDRRACMPPPERAVCLYAHALEAGVRFPLHSFFSEVLTHFCLAPGQLTPSGWRILVGFVVLCHDAGVQQSAGVFCYFFSPVAFKLKCWYGFQAKNDDRKLFVEESDQKLFTGLSASDEAWKGRFFFLTSPEPWPCPVRWGEPPSKYKYSPVCVDDPVLTSQQKKAVAKLLDAHRSDRTAVNLRIYLSDTKLSAAFSSNLASPPPPGPALRSTGAKEMDSSAAKVKTEPDGDTPTVSLKKRKHEEAAIAKDSLCRSEQSTQHAAHGCSASASGLDAPPGFSPEARHSPVPATHDGDSADWEASRKMLERITTPSWESEFAAAKPSDVVASSYSAMIRAANCASFSFGYALELEKKLAARDEDNAALRVQLVELEKKLATRDKENAALQVQLESAKAKLTAVKRTVEAEVNAKTTTV
uniref:Transposase (putative) gypsy type domain-containing protein n=5 Tax=Triticinae TaxID=1648030 RepID=A0A453QW95_AEGTS